MKRFLLFSNCNTNKIGNEGQLELINYKNQWWNRNYYAKTKAESKIQIQSNIIFQGAIANVWIVLKIGLWSNYKLLKVSSSTWIFVRFWTLFCILKLSFHSMLPCINQTLFKRLMLFSSHFMALDKVSIEKDLNEPVFELAISER